MWQIDLEHSSDHFLDLHCPEPTLSSACLVLRSRASHRGITPFVNNARGNDLTNDSLLDNEFDVSHCLALLLMLVSSGREKSRRHMLLCACSNTCC